MKPRKKLYIDLICIIIAVLVIGIGYFVMNQSSIHFISNHDIEMLMATKRPMYLKNRILNDVGHLNNEYSAQLMSEMIGENTKEIILAHLSQEANTKEKAIETYKQVFKEQNIQFDQIKVASQVDVISGGKYED